MKDADDKILVTKIGLEKTDPVVTLPENKCINDNSALSRDFLPNRLLGTVFIDHRLVSARFGNAVFVPCSLLLYVRNV